jgi:hypothetical protein
MELLNVFSVDVKNIIICNLNNAEPSVVFVVLRYGWIVTNSGGSLKMGQQNI